MNEIHLCDLVVSSGGMLVTAKLDPGIGSLDVYLKS